MKITLLLCLLVALTGCTRKIGTTTNPSTDSPIIISDGSTRIHHRSLQESGNKVTANDAGYHPLYLECPKNKGFACDNTSLYSGWQVTVFDSGNNTIATVYSPDGNEVDATFNYNINPVQIDFDLENFLGKVVATNEKTRTIQSFTLVNGTGGSSLPPTGSGSPPLACANTNGPCRIKIHYGQP
jgi:hypothetical protein